MPKSHHLAAKPKEQTTLADMRYTSGAATKSMNSYEKFLRHCAQTTRAKLTRAAPQHHGHDRGDLCTLFATIH